MENIVIKACITNTSNKVSENYKAETPTKTLYLDIHKDDVKTAKDFGIKIYTPNDGGKDFGVCKAAKTIEVYKNNRKQDKISGTIETKNFKTTGYVLLNIIKGEKLKNEFLRVQAIGLVGNIKLEEIEQKNPFENVEINKSDFIELSNNEELPF